MLSKVFIVIPVFNRVEITRRCLSLLSEQNVYSWARVVVVDDASSDGTPEMVQQEFPQTVLLNGNGELWWTGGINKGMSYAFEKGAEFIIWLNDDCYLNDGVLEILVRQSGTLGSISLAQAITDSGHIYGGHLRTRFGQKQVVCNESEVKESNIINGNCVCIPRKVVETIGFCDDKHFPHVRADSDYSLRAYKAGFPSYVIGNAACESEEHLYPQKGLIWLFADMSFKEVWATFFSLRTGLNFRVHFWWCLKYWPVVFPILFVKPYAKFFLCYGMRALFSVERLRRWIGKYSKEWQSYSGVK